MLGSDQVQPVSGSQVRRIAPYRRTRIKRASIWISANTSFRRPARRTVMLPAASHIRSFAAIYLAFLIKTTSDAEVPSEMTSLLSRDQSNENIVSDLKLVILFGSPPSIG